jgi:hypothetical protein
MMVEIAQTKPTAMIVPKRSFKENLQREITSKPMSLPGAHNGWGLNAGVFS